MRKVVCLGLAALGLALPANADTLEEALQQSYLNNPTLLAERTGAQIADETLANARAQGRTQLSLSGSAGYQWSDTNRFDDLGPLDFGGGGIDFTAIGGDQGGRETGALQLEATRPLYTGGRIKSGVRQAEAGVASSRALLDSVRQDTFLSTVTAYVDVLRDEESVRIRQNNVAVLEEQTRAAADRFDVGVVTRTDVAAAEARLAGARALLAGANAQLEGSLATYEALVGNRPEDLDPVPPLPALPQTLDDAVATALVGNPDLDAATEAVRAAEEAIKVARGALRPEISFVGSAGFQRNLREDLQDESASALIQGRIPLYEADTLRSTVRSAQLRRTQALQQRDAIERQIRAGIAQAWFGFEAASRSIDASRAQVEAAEIAYKGGKEELAVGVRTTLDVLDQEQDLFEARLALVEAERDAYVAAHQLLRGMGALSLDRLGAVDRYDPEAYAAGKRRKWLLTDGD